MGFKTVKYQTNKGTIVRIRASTQTIGAAGNTAITAALTDEKIYAYCSNPGSKRNKQLNARGLRLGRDVGADPNIFRRKTFIPIFSPTAWADTEIGDTVLLGGTNWVVDDKVDEA